MPAIAPSIIIEAKGNLPKSHFNASFYGKQLSSDLNASKADNAELQFDDKYNTHFDVSSIPTELILETRVYGKAYLRLERDLENEGDGEVPTDFDRKVITNPHQIRDEITFMSALQKKTKLALHDELFHKHNPLKVYGNEQNTGLIPDESHLSLQTQLADRLDSSFSRRQVRQQSQPKGAWRDTQSKTNSIKVRNALKDFKSNYDGGKRTPRLRITKLLDVNARNKAKFSYFITRVKRNLTSESRDGVCDEKLFEAIDSLQPLEVETALSQGANIEQVMEGSTPFQTIFRRSCKADSGDEPCFSTTDNQARQNICEILVGWKCNVNECDSPKTFEGYAPLHYAANYGCLDRLIWILGAGAHIDVKTKYDSMTALMIACRRGSFEHCYELIRRGASFFAKDDQGRTTMHHAVKGNNLIVVKFLLRCGAEHSASVLALAKNRNSEIYKFLLRQPKRPVHNAVIIKSLLIESDKEVNFDACGIPCVMLT